MSVALTPAAVTDLAGAALGAGVLGTLLALGVWALVHHARRADLLTPVLWGLGLRLGVMLIAHVASLIGGGGGLMFKDDHQYLLGGMDIAARWRAGEVIDPAGYQYAGSVMFGFDVVCATAFLLVKDIVAAKLVNVLASAGTVLVVGLIAGKIWGQEARRRAAWAAALMPTLVWWSAPLMKEAVAGFLLVACLLAMLTLGRRWAIAALVATLGALVITRAPAAAALVIAVVAVVAGVLLRNRGDFNLRRVVGCGLAAAGLATAAVLALSHGDVAAFAHSYSSPIHSMIERYRQSGPTHVPVSVVQSLLAPYPWVFGPDTHNWDMALYPGMWAWYALYPLVGLSLLRHGRRPEVVLLALVVLALLTVNAFTSGFVFRQRSTIEPLLVLLAVGGLTSWREAAGLAAAAWALVGLAAAVHSRSVLTGLAILAGAGSMALVARRLSPADRRAHAVEAILPSLRGLADTRWHWTRAVGLPRRLLTAAPSLPAAPRVRARPSLVGKLVRASPAVEPADEAQK